MTTRDNASFSDLERARALGRRLRPEGLLPSVRPTPEVPPPPAYVRFELAPPPPEPPPFHDRLAHCLEATGARSIVVLGIDGRPIGVAGEWTSWPPARLEAAGARLAVALDQAERLEGTWSGARSVSFAVGPHSVAGLRVSTAAGRLTVGLLVDRPLGHEAIAAVTRAVQPE